MNTPLERQNAMAQEWIDGTMRKYSPVQHPQGRANAEIKETIAVYRGRLTNSPEINREVIAAAIYAGMQVGLRLANRIATESPATWEPYVYPEAKEVQG